MAAVDLARLRAFVAAKLERSIIKWGESDKLSRALREILAILDEAETSK